MATIKNMNEIIIFRPRLPALAYAYMMTKAREPASSLLDLNSIATSHFTRVTMVEKLYFHGFSLLLIIVALLTCIIPAIKNGKININNEFNTLKIY